MNIARDVHLVRRVFDAAAIGLNLFRNSNLCATVDTVAAFESCAEKALAEQGGSKLVSLSPDFRRRQAVFKGPKSEKWL